MTVAPDARRVLVLARGHIGDLVSAFPALRDVRAAWPRAHVTVLANEYVRGALDGCPWVDEVLYGFTYQRRGRLLRVARQLDVARRLLARYDVAIGLRFSPRTAGALALLSGARVRAGFHRGLDARLLTHDAGPEPTELSTRLRNVRVLEALGVAASPSYPRIDWVPRAAVDATTALLQHAGLKPGARFAALQLSCSWGCNEWADEKWAALADQLEVRGLALLAVGADEAPEHAKLAEVQRRTKVRLTSLIGRTSLSQLFDLVARAALVVGTDSALTQIALAQRTPAVVMWGIEPMAPNGPLPGELLEAIQHWDPATAPPPNPRCVLEGAGHSASSCHGPSCRQNSSLTLTTVEEVVERVERVLRRARPAGSGA